jgi:plasmid stabilization system protein ParE
MSHPVVVRPEAEQDLSDGRDWYERQREGLGGEFLTAVDEVFDHIRESPELHAAEYKRVRRTALNRFPYIVYYRLVGEVVEVIAVQHAGRHPRRWRSRA